MSCCLGFQTPSFVIFYSYDFELDTELFWDFMFSLLTRSNICFSEYYEKSVWKSWYLVNSKDFYCQWARVYQTWGDQVKLNQFNFIFLVYLHGGLWTWIPSFIGWITGTYSILFVRLRKVWDVTSNTATKAAEWESELQFHF